MTLTGIAQGGGLFERGAVIEETSNNYNTRSGLVLPEHHGESTDSGAEGPLGSGIAVLVGLGAAYLVGKKRREE
jgi:hypothetical protein